MTGKLKKGGPNIQVPKEHPYIITLNLINARNYTYSLEETDIELSSSAMTLPGSYQGWDPTADDVCTVESSARDFKYMGTHFFPDNTEFKFYDAGTWIGIVGDMAWDDAKTTANFVIGDGANIKIEKAGYYKVAADTKKMTASITKTGWEVIGSAAPYQWDKGVLMDYDPATKTWSITMTLTEGEIKFRWDGVWDKNFGGSLDALVQDGANIKVSAGTYTIVLDPNAQKASMTAN